MSRQQRCAPPLDCRLVLLRRRPQLQRLEYYGQIWEGQGPQWGPPALLICQAGSVLLLVSAMRAACLGGWVTAVNCPARPAPSD